MDISNYKAALFDFDGTLVDTEPQYSLFWGDQGRKYHPETANFDRIIKGQTLGQIFDSILKVKIQRTYDTAISLSGKYPIETNAYVHQKTSETFDRHKNSILRYFIPPF